MKRNPLILLEQENYHSNSVAQPKILPVFLNDNGPAASFAYVVIMQ